MQTFLAISGILFWIAIAAVVIVECADAISRSTPRTRHLIVAYLVGTTCGLILGIGAALLLHWRPQ